MNWKAFVEFLRPNRWKIIMPLALVFACASMFTIFTVALLLQSMDSTAAIYGIRVLHVLSFVAIVVAGAPALLAEYSPAGFLAALLATYVVNAVVVWLWHRSQRWAIAAMVGYYAASITVSAAYLAAYLAQGRWYFG